MQRTRDWLREAKAELRPAKDLFQGGHWSCYIPTRYPNAFDRGAPADQFFEEDARDALEDAEEVIRFAEGIVGPP